MTLTRDYLDGTLTFECDWCTNYEEFDVGDLDEMSREDFITIVNTLKGMKWWIIFDEGIWSHKCPNCQSCHPESIP